MNDIAGTGQGRSTPPEGRGGPLRWGCSTHWVSLPCTLFPYALTALLALLAGLAALALSGTEPFGSHTLCWQDNGQQVASDFGYVRGVWEGRHTLDWSYACGGSPRSSFHPTFNNLVSPLTWVVAAIPGLSAVTGLSLLFLLQITLLPLGALYYIRKTFPRLPAAFGMTLALIYAFGGFVMSKHSFLPFLNVAILFPWYVATLDTLLRRGRWVPYMLLLAFMLAVGTYFAYMWLLFTAVYASARTGWRWNSPVRQHTLCLFLASAGALALSAFSWLPSLLVTAGSARAGEAHFWWNATRAEVEPMFINWLSSLFVPLVLLFLLRLRLRWNRYALTLLVLLVGLVFTSATTLWHLSRPWDFEGRFAYMAEFMLICLMAGGLYPFCHGQYRLRWRLIPLVVLTVLVGVCYVDCVGSPWELLAVFLGSLALAACWRWRQAAVGVGLMGGLASLLCWMVLDWDKGVHHHKYQSCADRVKIAEWASQEVPAPEGRVKSHGHAAVENLAFFTPFESMSHFTACITAAQEGTLARWGYQRRTAVISTEGGTAASDTLLGIRYILFQEKDDAPYRVEENPYYFGLGLMTPARFLNGLHKEGGDPIDYQQLMLAWLLGEEHAGTRRLLCLPSELPALRDGQHYLQQPADGELCFCVESSYSRLGVVESLPRLVPISDFTFVQHSASGTEEAFIYHLPLSSLEALKRYGQELPVRSSYSGYVMKLRCRSTEERSMLFLPLLWQQGYEAAVDGRPSDVLERGGFVGIAMRAPGEHEVELVYRGRGKWEGGMVSLASLPLLLGAWGLGRRIRAPRCADSFCRRVLLAVSAVLLLWPLLTLPVGLLW